MFRIFITGMKISPIHFSCNTLPALKISDNETNFCANSVQITDKSTGKKVDAEVKFSNESADIKKVKLVVDGNCAGYATYSNINYPYSCPTLLREYASSDPKGAIYIFYMENSRPDKYSDVGLELHKIIKNISKKEGFSGKTALTAGHSSHCFHYNCGFRPLIIKNPINRVEELSNIDNAKKFAQIKEINKENKSSAKHADTHCLGAVLMVRE